MKSSDKPELSKKWWTSSKPGEIKGAELEKALAAAEKALADANKKGDEATIGAALGALASVGAAVDKTVKKELDKKKHKDQITVLEKYELLIKSESKRLEEARAKLAKTAAAAGPDGEADDEEVGDNQLFEKDYLHKMMKLIKSSGKELKFAFGLNTKAPEASTLLLKRKGKPEMLFKLLKKQGEYNNRLLTYGYALPDSEDSKTLVFRLEQGAGEPPQIIKLGRKYLRADKGLRFRKLKLILPGGRTLQDNEPDTEDEEGNGEFQAAGTQQPAEDSAARASAEAAAPVEDLRKQFKEARKRWVAARDRAEQDLEIVKDGIRDYYFDDPEQFPIAMKKLKEFDEIMDNLSDDLRDALDAYVSTPLNQQARLNELGANARQLLDRFANYVERSPLLNAIDQKEFADVQIKAPITAAMRDLARTIR